MAAMLKGALMPLLVLPSKNKKFLRRKRWI